MSNTKYYFSDMLSPIDRDLINKLSKEEQIEIMNVWFRSNYEDPAENCPYESKEGGYEYIWGGPYDAKEELYNEFSDIVAESTIDELVEELESECFEWSGQISSEDYNEYFYSSIYDNNDFTETLKDNLNNIKRLLDIELNDDLKQNLYKMLFVNVVTTLETFLADAFINTVLNNRELLKNFVCSCPDFANRKFSLNQIFDRFDTIENEVKTYLLDLIWHNIAKVSKMYKTTLNIDFPKDIKTIFRGITKRHDIVHRNGKTKDGDTIVVSRDEVVELMDKVNEFAEEIDTAFNV